MKKYLIAIITLVLTTLSFTMCVEDAMPPQPDAKVSNLVISPAIPTPSDDVIVFADVTSAFGIAKVQLVYSISGTETTVDMTVSGDKYSATIPKQAKNTVVNYYIFVENNEGATILYPETAPESTLSYTVFESDGTETIKIVINEFCASNDKMVVPGASLTDMFPDWFELYNAGNVAVNIAGWYVTDGLDDPMKFQIPDTDAGITTIPVGGFLIIYCDKEMADGPTHVDFSLSSGGEDIGISADGISFMDSFTYPDAGLGIPNPGTDNSGGLITDGGNTWTVFNTADATPGASNIK